MRKQEWDMIKKLYEKYRPEVLAVTDGSRGGYYIDGGEVHHYDSFKITPKDTNGAGDTFHGAFIAARLKGMGVLEAATFASATSALKCTRFGAQEGIPGYEEVLDFMKDNKGVIQNG